MSAQPGWYDAGVAGQQRWWDGTRWTEHVRAATAAPVMPPQAPAAVQPPMGWYPVPGTSDVRWWDGKAWAPHRLREGRSRADGFAIEPANVGWGLGICFIALGMSQLSLQSISGQPFFAITPYLFFITGIIWLIGGLRAAQLAKLPAPSTAPVLDASVRPLPGEVEGPGAGWYPVTGQITRWWTGAQWSLYIAEKHGVRPTHSGRRGYRTSMSIGWALVALGALGAIGGLLLMGAVGPWGGMMIVVPAVILGLAGGAVVLTVYLRRFALILPEQPPQPA
ncbi:DUF2510 domain-containing protein [Microbacterium sp.]|uniref:DUF2510 domain-containing protein n=1 Tax=Microbacterium sp. TaxID=51671 RepID=UPI00262C1ABA|nr:DUF2510 domain-containing protein [Microbacterium sp.]